MKIAVIGANGQLGSDICKEFTLKGHEIVELNHDTINISDFQCVKAIFDLIKPHLVINTAALHNLDACEIDPQRAFEINGIGARNLATLSKELDYTLFHISTDYVFDGTKKTPYLETDYPIPLNVYGNTKLAGENFVRTIADRYFIFRVSGLYGTNPCRAKGGNNFVKLMLKLAAEKDEVRVVDDEVLTPTFTDDIAKQLVLMSGSDIYGLYHATAQGACSWYAFTQKIYALAKVKTKLSIADSSEFAAKIPRPKFSVLENYELQKIGMDLMPQWEYGLQRYLKEIGLLN
jgi:dTDP-4-dehydrorhamnose reductase